MGKLKSLEAYLKNHMALHSWQFDYIFSGHLMNRTFQQYHFVPVTLQFIFYFIGSHMLKLSLGLVYFSSKCFDFFQVIVTDPEC